jgi:hypothetical protein
MFLTKVGEKNQKTLFGSIIFSENISFYEITWKNMVDPDGPRRRT